MKKLLLLAVAVVALFGVIPTAEAQVGFGRSVAVANGTVFVGEPGNQANPGYVYAYRADTGQWVEVEAITAAEAMDGDGFGTAVAADEWSLLVSAVNGEHGAIHILQRNADGTWTETGTLTAKSDTAGTRFGAAMARDGNTLVVGAPGAGDGWGAAYVFSREDGVWSQTSVLAADMPNAETSDAAEDGDADEQGEEAPEPVPARFGTAVAISGDWILIGAPSASQGAGAVHAYSRGEDGAWQFVTTLGEDFSEENDRFGSAIYVADGEALVGAPGVNDLGAVRRFLVSEEGEWAQSASLMPFDGSAREFGSALAATDDHVYVAAPLAETFRGVVYRYTRAGDDSWSEVTKIGPAGLAPGHRFGSSFAISGDTIVAGIPGADFGAGKAAILSQTYGGWDSTLVVSEVKGIDAITGGSVPCDNGMVGRFTCESMDLLAYLPIQSIGGDRGVRANDIWGWTDSATNRDYAIIGLSNAASFVDVTDPNQPFLVGTLPMTAGARSSVWRDIKVYSDHAFIVSDSAGEHGMQVLDLTRMRDYSGTPITFTADADYNDIASAHNVVINEDSAFAFIVGASGGGETCGGGLHMVNIEDPKQPVFAGCFQDTRTGRRGTGYSHDAQCVSYHGPDSRFDGHEICFGSNETALSIADVTDKRNPEAIGMSSYPNVAYSHQGWLTDDQRYFYMNDEGDEASGLVPGTRTIIWDVQDLTDPIVVHEYVSDNPAVDHNLYTIGNLMYQSNYDSGLRVFDISDPENIAEIGFLDTVPFGEDGSGGGGSWSNYPYFKSGIVVVTSMNEGFFVAKLRDAVNPNHSHPDNN